MRRLCVLVTQLLGQHSELAASSRCDVSVPAESVVLRARRNCCGRSSPQALRMLPHGPNTFTNSVSFHMPTVPFTPISAVQSLFPDR